MCMCVHACACVYVCVGADAPSSSWLCHSPPFLLLSSSPPQSDREFHLSGEGGDRGRKKGRGMGG